MKSELLQADAVSSKTLQAEVQEPKIAANGHGKTRHRLLFIERRMMVREWLMRAFKGEPGLTSCGSAKDCVDLKSIEAGMARFSPDLVIVGTGLECGTSLEIVASIKTRPKPPLVLCIAAAEEELEALAMLRAGARGYVSCFETPRKICLAVRTVLGGGIHLSERIAVRLVERLLLPQQNGKAELAVDRLSERELEVFKFIGRGDMPSEIAGKIKLSVKTVENYRARVMEKLGIKGARELSHLAIGWVSQHKS